MSEEINREKKEEIIKHSSGRNKAQQIVQSVSAKAWLLLRLNVLFIVFSVPVVTAPASLAAMTRVLMKIVREDDSDVWNDFWREFKAGFLKSLAAGLITGMIMAVVFFAGYIVYTSFEGFISSLGIAFIIVFEALAYFVSCYLFTLVVLVDIKLKQCIINSFLLALIELRRNLLLLFPLGLLVACVLLYPVSLPLFIFILFALCQYIVCHTVAKVIQRRIIDPHYSKNQAF